MTARTLGQEGGAESITLTTGHLPAHTHQLRGTNGAATQTTPNGNNLATQVNNTQYLNAASNVNLSADAIGSTGSKPTAPLSNVPPFLILNFIIALQGRDPRAGDPKIIPTANP